jgi:hypothetical protein
VTLDASSDPLKVMATLRGEAVAATRLGRARTDRPTELHHRSLGDALADTPGGIPVDVRGAIVPIGWPDRRSGPVTRRPDAKVVQRTPWRHSIGPWS